MIVPLSRSAPNSITQKLFPTHPGVSGSNPENSAEPKINERLALIPPIENSVGIGSCSESHQQFPQTDFSLPMIWLDSPVDSLLVADGLRVVAGGLEIIAFRISISITS